MRKATDGKEAIEGLPPVGFSGPTSGTVPGEVAGDKAQDRPPVRGDGPQGTGRLPEGERGVSSFVYLIGPWRGMHKIGQSVAPNRRAGELSQEILSDVMVVSSIQTTDPNWLESYLHEAFSHRRRHGEWFSLTDDEMTLFRSMKSVDIQSDLPTAVIALYLMNQKQSPRRKTSRGRPSLPPEERMIYYVGIRYSEVFRERIGKFLEGKRWLPESEVWREAMDRFLKSEGF